MDGQGVIDRPTFWIVTFGLAAATYAIRLSFLALSQKKPFSARTKRLLDFVPVTVLPALIAPLIFFPDAAGGALDPPRVIAAAAALAIGFISRNVLVVIGAGMAVLLGLQTLMQP